MTTLYGYDGGTQRVVTIANGKRKVLCWGDAITADEIAPFMEHYGHAWIETIADPAAERLAYPIYAGRA